MICSNSQCFVRKYTVFSPHDLVFLLIKRKKNYKAKFSTKLILKKIDKDNFGRKKTLEKKHCSNWQCFVRKTTVFSSLKLTKIILEKNHKKNSFREIL